MSNDRKQLVSEDGCKVLKLAMRSMEAKMRLMKAAMAGFELVTYIGGKVDDCQLLMLWELSPR